MKKMPIASKILLSKLIVARDVYQEFGSRLSDELLKITLKRITIEKRIFVKDFNMIHGFNLNDHLKEQNDNIAIERENLRNKMLHLLSSNDDQAILEFILEKEEGLIKLYYMFLGEPIDDEFVRIVMKNQLDETKQSIQELNDLIVTYNTE
jgi:hypothetical protein